MYFVRGGAGNSKRGGNNSSWREEIFPPSLMKYFLSQEEIFPPGERKYFLPR